MILNYKLYQLILWDRFQPLQKGENLDPPRPTAPIRIIGLSRASRRAIIRRCLRRHLPALPTLPAMALVPILHTSPPVRVVRTIFRIRSARAQPCTSPWPVVVVQKAEEVVLFEHARWIVDAAGAHELPPIRQHRCGWRRDCVDLHTIPASTR